MYDSIEFDGNDAGDTRSAIQILSPKSHEFRLKKDTLVTLLNADDIKDRDVVIISIAGALRKGKSFLLNFFLKYLNAMYKRHDVYDWIGENENSTLNGFKWRGGQRPETAGIWMWSEIFTHNFKNGDKVAIILLDTQGIFDDSSSMKECTTIFTLSTLVSSVQCFNIMQSVQEDHLQYLRLFTEYGRLSLRESSEMPFQKLIFIVRDWPYGRETGSENAYGQNTDYIDRILRNNQKRTVDMNCLRKRIRSSFESIDAFLLPYPGVIVAENRNFDGKLKQIDKEFIKYVKDLTPMIFAPENLIVKKINGNSVKACNLIELFEKYIKMFNGNELPEPKEIFLITADFTNTSLYNECLKMYESCMWKKIEECEIYIEEDEFKKIHKDAKSNAYRMFDDSTKLGDDNLIKKFKEKLKRSIKEAYERFDSENDKKRTKFNYISYLKMAGNAISFGIGTAVATASVGAIVGGMGWVSSVMLK